MSDRELLELAAKAAGYEVLGVSSDPDRRGALCRINGEEKIWLPLTDDGDALRLAVKLGMRVGSKYRHDDMVIVEFWVNVGDPLRGMNGWEVQRIAETSADNLASTRRAIVRAAAEIGKTK